MAKGGHNSSSTWDESAFLPPLGLRMEKDGKRMWCDVPMSWEV